MQTTIIARTATGDALHIAKQGERVTLCGARKVATVGGTGEATCSTCNRKQAARERIARHEAREAAYHAARADRPTPAVSALDTCNACDAEVAHDGCTAGYCAGCCPAH